MQTLLDPFELAQHPPRAPAPPLPRAPRAESSVEIAIDVDEAEPEAPSGVVLVAPPSAKPVALPSRPGPDSSGRLRCWCSED